MKTTAEKHATSVSGRSGHFVVHPATSKVSSHTTTPRHKSDILHTNDVSIEQSAGSPELAHRHPSLSTEAYLMRLTSTSSISGSKNTYSLASRRTILQPISFRQAFKNDINIEELLEIHLAYKCTDSKTRRRRQSVTSSLISTPGGTILIDFEVDVARRGDSPFGSDTADTAETVGGRRVVKFDIVDQTSILFGIGAQFGEIGYAVKHAGM